MPASANASSRSFPAGPTKGRPTRSSWSPGCSPTIMIAALEAPSPKTVCVAVFQRSQAVHALAARRNTGIVLPRGTRLAAVMSAGSGLFPEMPGEDFIAHTQCSVLDWDPATVELLTPSITPCCWRPTSGNDLTLSDETAYTLIAARPG